MMKTESTFERLLDLQIEFTAATDEMNRTWVVYRNTRDGKDQAAAAAALDAYTASLERCQALKEAIYEIKVSGRAA